MTPQLQTLLNRFLTLPVIDEAAQDYIDSKIEEVQEESQCPSLRLEQERDALQEEVNDLEDDVSRLNDDINSLENELEDLKNEREALFAEIEELKARLSKYE